MPDTKNEAEPKKTKAAAAKSKSAVKDGAKATTKKSSTPKAPKKTAAKVEEVDKVAVEQAEQAQPAEELVAQQAEQAQPAEEPVAQQAEQAQPAEEPVAQQAEQAQPAEEPVAQQAEQAQPAEEPVAQQAEQAQPAEEPVAQQAEQAQPAEEPVAEVAAVADTVEKAKKPEKVKGDKSARIENFAKKTDALVNKGKLPIFIIVNVLFALSAIFLIIFSFNITIGSPDNTKYYNLFKYLGDSEAVKMYMANTVTAQWSGFAFAMMTVFIFLAVLVPLGLAVKNTVILFVKKDKNVYKLDAIIAFATSLAYIAFTNMIGCNIAVGHVINLIISTLILLFTIVTLFVQKSNKSMPIFSLVNIVLIAVAIMMITGAVFNMKIDGKNAYSYYAAGASSVAGGAGTLSFLLMLVTVGLLIVLFIMQVQRLPQILEIVIPSATIVTAVIPMIVYATNVPDGYSLGVVFVIGVILTVLICVADILFALLKPLKRYKVTIADDKKVAVAAASAGVAEPCAEAGVQPAEQAKEQPVVQPVVQPAEQANEQPVVQPAEDAPVFCPYCGAKQVLQDAVFCYKCGKNLPK